MLVVFLNSLEEGFAEVLDAELCVFFELFGVLGCAGFLVLVALDSSSSLFVVADEGQADRQDRNRVVLDEVSG